LVDLRSQIYIPLLAFNQQRDGSAKRLSKSDPDSKSVRFSAIIDESIADDDTDADSASTVAAAAAAQQRPSSASRMETESPAERHLRSLLRDEFIIRFVYSKIAFQSTD